MSSLNPVMPVGRQLMEVPIIHQKASEAEARARALFMLGEVNLPDPESVFDRYPHQLSGGQQQRVVIAMALMAEPSLLLMDEPTTGLDVTVEAAVLDLVRRLREKHNSSIVFISHNLGTVVRICDRIGVMYAGELVEEGPIGEVFRDPRHPYTRGLLELHPGAGQQQDLGRPGADPGPGALDPQPAAGLHLLLALQLCGSAALHHRAASRPSPCPAASIIACNASAMPSCRRASGRRPRSRPGRPSATRRTILTVDHLSKFYRQSPGIFSGGRVL